LTKAAMTNALHIVDDVVVQLVAIVVVVYDVMGTILTFDYIIKITN